jgi:hypothetical protein
MIGAIIGVAGLVVLNIIIVAFGYGKLTQKVDDHGRRLGRIESLIINGHGGGQKNR